MEKSVNFNHLYQIFVMCARTLSSICSISMESESKTCSLSNGAVSADVLGIVDVPILLYATNFISISFSNFRACFRSTKKINEKYTFQWVIKPNSMHYLLIYIITIPFWSTHFAEIYLFFFLLFGYDTKIWLRKQLINSTLVFGYLRKDTKI